MSRKKQPFSTWGVTLNKQGGLFRFARFEPSQREGRGWSGLFQQSSRWGDDRQRAGGLFSALRSFAVAFTGAFASFSGRGAFGTRFTSGAFGQRAEKGERGKGLLSLLNRRNRKTKEELESGMFRTLNTPLLLVSTRQQTHTPRPEYGTQLSFLATPEATQRDAIIHAPWATSATVARYDRYTLDDLYKARHEINRLIRQQKPGMGDDLDVSPFGARGQIVRAYGMDPANRYDLQYEVVELDQLVPSNTLSGAINPAYPAELQPRDRTRMASQAQIQSIVQDFVPDAYVDEFMTIDRGAPIIGGDLAVESGNGRVLALLTLREASPAKYDEYREAVLRRARDLGIDEGAVWGMTNPVLVRRRISDVDRVEFAREANQEAVLSQSAVEVARQDADLISDEMVDGLQIGETQTPDEALRSGRNSDFVRSFLQRLPENERAGLVTAEGEISQSLINRMKAAIFAKAFPSSGDLGGRIFESVDDNVRRLTGGLMGAIVQLVKAERLAGAGLRGADLTIADDLAVAVQKFSDLREQRMSVDDYMAQGKLFGEDLTGDQLRILQALDERSRSSKAVREMVAGWADLVDRSPNPNQISMFGDPPPNRADLISRWL